MEVSESEPSWYSLMEIDEPDSSNSHFPFLPETDDKWPTEDYGEDYAEPGDDLEFMYFEKLPIEVRMRIWRYAAPDPHLMKQQQFGGRFMMERSQRWTFKRKVPALLHACRESRSAYLAKDEADVPEMTANRGHPVYALCTFGKFDPPVFFCATYDAVLADVEVFFKLGIRETARHVAIDRGSLGFDPWRVLLPQFCSITQLSVVMKDWDWWSVRTHLRNCPVSKELWVTNSGRGSLEDEGVHRVFSLLARMVLQAMKEQPNFNPPKLLSAILQNSEGGWRALSISLIQHLDGRLQLSILEKD